MTVYVDDMRRRTAIVPGTRVAGWSHLFADTPEELAAVAEQLGLKPSWLQHAGTYREHYDVTETIRLESIQLGSVQISYPRGTADLLARKKGAL